MSLTINLHLSYTHLVYECINPLRGAEFEGGLIDAIPPTFELVENSTNLILNI